MSEGAGAEVLLKRSNHSGSSPLTGTLGGMCFDGPKSFCWAPQISASQWRGGWPSSRRRPGRWPGRQVARCPGAPTRA